jgi:Sensors of blue-light using FAD
MQRRHSSATTYHEEVDQVPSATKEDESLMKPSSLIHYLVYTSRETHPMTDKDLSALLEESRRCNETSKVTGMLLYKDGKFLQALEGDEAIVESLYQRIRGDARHKDGQVLLTGEVSKRQFPDWSMGFTNLSNWTEKDLPGFSSFLSDGFDAENMRKQPQRVYRLLLQFRKLLPNETK